MFYKVEMLETNNAGIEMTGHGLTCVLQKCECFLQTNIHMYIHRRFGRIYIEL